MNFNVQARANLAKFSKKFPSANKRLSKGDIRHLSKEALALFKSYYLAPEVSLLAQCEYFDSLIKQLNKLDTIVKKQRPWWHKLIALFGYRSDEEQQLSALIVKIKEARMTVADKKLYPSPLPKALRFLGLNPRNAATNPQYAQYLPKEKVTYLSHHLMGNTNLNHHKILQGKSFGQGYRHFANDLNDFIQHEGTRLDASTQKLLAQLLKQINRSSALVKELETAKFILASKARDPIAQQKCIDDLSYRIQKAIIELPQGESVLIPHGFRSKKGGHATVIECTKINANEVTFKIINTGSGQVRTPDYKLKFTPPGNYWTPIRVTSPMSIAELNNNQFFAELLTPLLVANKHSAKKMKAFVHKLYKQGMLHNSEQWLTLQTNGTCAHTSLLEWFKSRVPSPTFQLFNFLTVDKALHHLDQFKAIDEAWTPPKNINSALADLRKAGIKTVDIEAAKLVMEKNRIANENDQLKAQLARLLSKKGKRLNDINDFTAYYEKKLRKNKLSLEEQEQIDRADSMTAWKTGVLSPRPNGKGMAFFKPEAPLSKRAQKAILAKKISGHHAFLDASNEINLRCGL